MNNAILPNTANRQLLSQGEEGLISILLSRAGAFLSSVYVNC